MPIFDVEFDVSGLKKGTQEAASSISGMTQQIDKSVKAVDLWQDSAGRWRNASGHFASASEKAAAGINKIGKESKQTAGEVDGFSKAMSSASTVLKGLAVGYVLTKLNEVRQELVKSGSDAQEAANKFDVVFSSVTDAADATVENLRKAYGMSRVGARDALSGVADLLTGLGMTQDKALDLANQTVQLGTDLASFTNYAGGATGATDALTKALLGETEQAKMLGVVLSENQMEEYATSVGKSWKELDLAEKAQLRLNAAIQQSPNAIGDFARSMDSYANQVRIAEAMSKDFMMTVGEGVVEAHTSALIAINGNRNGIDQLATAISGFLGVEGQGLISNLESIGENGKTASSEISVLAVNFIQAAGGAKALWNMLQMAVDGIIAVVNAVLVGKDQLSAFGEALYKTMQFDFAGAKEAMAKAGELGKNWAENVKSGFSTNMKDFSSGVEMFENPEVVFAKLDAAVQKRRLEQRKSAQETTASLNTEEQKRLKAASDATAAYEKIFSKTNEGQIKAAQDAYAAASALQKEALDKGAITQQEYDKRIVDLTKARDEKITAINKRGSNTRLSEAEKEAKKFTEATAQYDAGLKQLRNEVSSLEDSLDPSLTKFEKLRKQIEAERDASIQNADVKAEETVRRKQATAAQAKETAELEKRKAKLTATQKLDELENQNLRDKADFYKDLAEKTGRYSTSMEYQNQLLEKQREIWLGMGIPVKDVQEMISQLQLESSRDPFDGITRGLQGFITEATDGAKAMESTFSDLFNGMDSGFHDVWEQMLEDGKVSLSSFKSLFASFLADLMHMALTRPITVQIAGAVSGMLGTGGVAYAAGGAGGSGGGGGMGNLSGVSNLSSFLPDSFTSGLSGIMGATLPGTVSALTTPGAYTAGEILLMQGGGTTAGVSGGSAALMSGGLSLGSALMYGGLGSLGYSMLGGKLGLPQNKYSGITSGLGAGLGAWGASAALSGTALGATLGSAVPVVGTVIGAALGGLASSLLGGERKTHPSVYTKVEDASLFGSDWESLLTQGAWTDRASVSDAAEIFKGLGQVADTTANTILSFAQALPEEYAGEVINRLNAETVSFGRTITAGRGDIQDWGPSTWNFQFHDEEQLQEAINTAGEDIQRVMLNALSDAVGSVDMSAMFSSLDFSSTEGLEKAMNAINSVNAITDAIDAIREPQTQAEQQAAAFVEQMNALEESVKSYGLNAQYAEQLVGEYRTAYVDSYVEALEEMFNPLSQIEQQAKGYKEAIDGYVAALTTMGASEAQLAQVRGYTQTAIDNIISSLESSLSPLSEIEQTRQNANASIDQHIAALRQLGASESEITRVESMRAEAVRQATEELLRSFSQGLEQRYATLNGTSDAVSRAISQENELREAIQKFGEGSAQVAELLHVQAAENVYAAQASVDALQNQLNQLKAQAIQAEISALNEQMSAAKTLKDTWENLSKSLLDSRTKLWTSNTNALGLFARRDAAQSEFDRLYSLTMSGDKEAAAKLASSGDTLLSLLKETSANGEEYTAGFWNVEQKLKDAESVAGKQLSEAQKSYNALESQLKTQQSMLDALGLNNSSLDAINAQIVTVGQQLAEALGNLNIAQSNPNYGGATSGGGFVSWQDKLLQEKADALNAGQTLAPGQTAGGWTPEKVLDAIKENGWTVSEWYEKFGKPEGFASGGITPRNTPFLVGEKGPELMMSPQQYGVLNNQATRQLMMMPAVGTDGGATAIIAQLRENNAELKEQNRILYAMLLENQGTRKNTANTADSVENMVRTGVRARQQ